MSYNGYAITFIRGHYEAYEGNQFIVSADTVTEIKEELDKRDSYDGKCRLEVNGNVL